MNDLGNQLARYKNKSEDIAVSELFHENTKLHPETGFLNGPKAEFSLPELRSMAKGYKTYPYAKTIPLPEKECWDENTIEFDQVIENRRSVRSFGSGNLSLKELSRLLFQTYGITGEIPIPGGGIQPLRTAPSGGALYPAEIYIGVRQVEELDNGIYHYQVSGHQLELIDKEDPTQKLFEALCSQEHCKVAGVIFLITGVIARTKFKYGERGYRYVLLDIGHLGQNLYLSCTAQNLAVMTTCGFYDDQVNEILKIDGEAESMMYAAFVGKKDQG